MTVHFAPEMCLYVAGKWEATIDANNSGGEIGFVFAKSTIRTVSGEEGYSIRCSSWCRLQRRQSYPP